nr:uncharacterized protein LOC112990847 isoform X2 [Dromaius novaehollandiae]
MGPKENSSRDYRSVSRTRERGLGAPKAPSEYREAAGPPAASPCAGARARRAEPRGAAAEPARAFLLLLLLARDTSPRRHVRSCGLRWEPSWEPPVKNARLEEKRRKERKKALKARKSVLIAYECLCLKNYRIDVVVLFFDSLSVTFF